MTNWKMDMKEQGISDDHIESMKNRVLQSSEKYYLYYDEVDKPEQTLSNVDVSKIGGIVTGWPTANRSVYELFFSVTRELAIAEPPLHWRRILQNVESLRTNGLQSQYQFYTDASLERSLRDGLPEFDYFEEDDIYFSNATHRTISAIMFHAPHMVGYVTTYHKNEEKFRNYTRHMETKQRWNDALTTNWKNIAIEESNHINDNRAFRVYIKHPRIYLFTLENPLIKEMNDNFLRTDVIQVEEIRVHHLCKKLQEINQRLRSMNVNTLPFLLRFAKNNKMVYLMIAEFYMIREESINIREDSMNDIMRKIKASVKKSNISKNVPSN